MIVQPHPTHDRDYGFRPVAYALLLAAAGIGSAIGVISLVPDDAAWAGIAKAGAFLSGVLVAGASFLYLGVRKYLHGWALCPKCSRPIRRSRTDYVATYYPCRRCEITWICGCHKQADGA